AERYQWNVDTQREDAGPRRHHPCDNPARLAVKYVGAKAKDGPNPQHHEAQEQGEEAIGPVINEAHAAERLVGNTVLPVAPSQPPVQMIGQEYAQSGVDKHGIRPFSFWTSFARRPRS